MNKMHFVKKLNILFLITLLTVLTSFIFVLDDTQASSCVNFNTHSNDKKTLRLANATQGDTEWTDPISANPGDKIGFDVYYHNVYPGTTAYNTKIKIVFPTEKQNQIISTAHLWANNSCNTVTDTGIINISSSSERLVFSDTACWYPNQGTVCQKIPVTKTSNSVEVNIGNIRACWQYQGHVVFEATLTDTPLTVDLTANGSDGPIDVSYKSNVKLEWKSENASYCEASGDWAGNRAVNGTETIQMNQVKLYNFNLTCKDSGGTRQATDSVTVQVNPNPPTVVTLPAVTTY